MSLPNQGTKSGGDAHTKSIDPDGYERVDGVRTADRSPEGAPANPDVSRAGILWILVGSLASVIALGVVTWLFLGPWAALLVLALGASLAVFGNPAVWAAGLRSRERAP
tara:strand:+ start:12256 stop:12582 length:327 start_codon:yes stop_codon:yes gene_type:complete